MAKSYESLMECETTIHWDQTGEPAVLWTADPKVRKEWGSWGFPVEIWGGGWRSRVDPSRISYKSFKKPSKSESV